MSDRNPFDDHEASAQDNDRAIPAATIPGQRPPSDTPRPHIPRQPRPEER